MSRPGQVYCCTYDHFTPDFIAIGKGCAGGYAPISAVVTKGTFEDIIANGTGRIQLGHTFAGYALGAAAMLETQKRVQTPEMLLHVRNMGNKIRSIIDAELSDHPFYVETRGRGLNSAFEYHCENVHGFSLSLAQAMKTNHNILINAKWHRKTFNPAFIIDDCIVERALEAYIIEFKMISKSWSGAVDSSVNISLALGGVKPGA